MFGLVNLLTAPSLTELARVRSQEREKETKRVGQLRERPRPRWLRREGRGELEGETRKAATPRGAVGPRGKQASLGEDAPTVTITARGWPAPCRLPAQLGRWSGSGASAARTLTARAPPRRGRPPPSARSPPRPLRPAGGRGSHSGVGATSPARALSARRGRPERNVTRAASWCPWRRSPAPAAARGHDYSGGPEKAKMPSKEKDKKKGKSKDKGKDKDKKKKLKN